MKKKRGLKINIHLTNRWLYTFIAIGILAIIVVGVYAATYSPSGAGHPYTEISTCGANQILKMNSAGTAWECGTGATETDPTVQGWAKTNNPSIMPGYINVSYVVIDKSSLYFIGTPGTYTTIDSCTTLCNNNRRPPTVDATSDLCIYAWNYDSNAWRITTCTDVTSKKRRCLCVGILSS